MTTLTKSGKKCPYCGSLNSKNADYCHYCLKSIEFKNRQTSQHVNVTTFKENELPSDEVIQEGITGFEEMLIITLGIVTLITIILMMAQFRFF